MNVPIDFYFLGEGNGPEMWTIIVAISFFSNGPYFEIAFIQQTHVYLDFVLQINNSKNIYGHIYLHFKCDRDFSHQRSLLLY